MVSDGQVFIGFSLWPTILKYTQQREKIKNELCHSHGLLWIQELYEVEREAREKNLDAQDRYLLRREKACPVMDKLGEWLVKEYTQLLPKSAIGKAIYYLVARYNK